MSKYVHIAASRYLCYFKQPTDDLIWSDFSAILLFTESKIKMAIREGQSWTKLSGTEQWARGGSMQIFLTFHNT